MSLRDRLEELEQPPPGCELLDIDLLLRECGYERREDGMVFVYAHEGWGSILTFPRHKNSVPQSRLRQILAFVRWHLEKEGRI